MTDIAWYAISFINARAGDTYECIKRAITAFFNREFVAAEAGEEVAISENEKIWISESHDRIKVRLLSHNKDEWKVIYGCWWRK